MLNTAKERSDAVPPHLRRSLRSALAISSLPFIFTFIVVAVFAWRKLFPILSGKGRVKESSEYASKPLSSNLSSVATSWAKFTLDRAAAFTFATTIALSTVLAELIFCEISNILNPAARTAALEITLSILLVSLIVVTPALEIHSITSAAGWKLRGLKRGTFLLSVLFDIVGLAGWLAGFSWIGQAALGPQPTHGRDVHGHSFSKGSLETIGIVGISLMASLAGFAAVSSLWQSFGVKVRKVTETDISRKQVGLDATSELLTLKRSRLRALERKKTSAPPEAFMNRMLGTFRSNTETAELSALRLEVSGLDTMRLSLSSSLSFLRARRDTQLASNGAYGRLCNATSYLFSLYCLYRVAATLVATFRRWWTPATSFATADPINNVLALLAKHWDPSIDRAAWSRQISFFLSGVMLLASFNAVLQTVLLFSRFTPAKVLHSAQQNLALLVSQISATYVVSSALLLRSNLPKEMGSVIESALGGAPLDAHFVERWFEGWFLGACAIARVGIWVARNIGGTGDWEDDIGDDVDVEGGKRRS